MDKHNIEDARRRRELRQLVLGNGFPMNRLVYPPALARRRRREQAKAAVKLAVYGTALVGLAGVAVVVEAVPMAYRALRAT